MNSSHLYQAGRAWAQSKYSFETLQRARRILDVATTNSDPMVVLRIAFAARDRQHFEHLVETHFESTPSLEDTLTFVRGIRDADPRPIAASA